MVLLEYLRSSLLLSSFLKSSGPGGSFLGSSLEKIQEWDQSLLLQINRGWTSPWMDQFFPVITDLHKNFWFQWVGGPLLLIFFVRIWGTQRKKEGWIFMIGLIMAILISDAIGGLGIKHWVERLRPSVQGIPVILRAPHYNGFSFVSNHAMNTFCGAFYVYSFFRGYGLFFILWAFLVSYSRLYVGVHFPSDVIGGALIGSGLGLAWARCLGAWMGSRRGDSRGGRAKEMGRMSEEIKDSARPQMSEGSRFRVKSKISDASGTGEVEHQ